MYICNSKKKRTELKTKKNTIDQKHFERISMQCKCGWRKSDGECKRSNTEKSDPFYSFLVIVVVVGAKAFKESNSTNEFAFDSHRLV